MRSILTIAGLCVAFCVARAKSPVETAMSDQWDSLRFSFAALQSDYSVEFPLFVVYRLKDGAQLLCYDHNKIITRRLEPSEVERIKSQLLLCFADVPAERPSSVEPNPPELVMTFSIDRGFNRVIVEKRQKPDDKSKALEVFSRLVQELTPKQ